METRVQKLEESVGKFEKYFWVAGVVATIFGVSGAFGLNAISSLSQSTSTIEGDLTKLSARLTQITEEIDSHIEKKIKEVDDHFDARMQGSNGLTLLSVGNQSVTPLTDTIGNNGSDMRRVLVWELENNTVPALLIVQASVSAGYDKDLNSGKILPDMLHRTYAFIRINGKLCGRDTTYLPDELSGATLSASVGCVIPTSPSVPKNKIELTYQYRPEMNVNIEHEVGWALIAVAE